MTFYQPRTGLFILVLLGLLAVPASAVELTDDLTIKAGKHDRENTPVRVVLREPAILVQAQTAKLTDESGKEISGQLTRPALLSRLDTSRAVVREMHFILPSLQKEETLRFNVTLSDAPSEAQGWTWKDMPGEYTGLSHQGRLVMRYMYRALDLYDLETARATFRVFHHLYNLAGTRLVTKGPGGLHQHRHGLFFLTARADKSACER